LYHGAINHRAATVAIKTMFIANRVNATVSYTGHSKTVISSNWNKM